MALENTEFNVAAESHARIFPNKDTNISGCISALIHACCTKNQLLPEFLMDEFALTKRVSCFVFIFDKPNTSLEFIGNCFTQLKKGPYFNNLARALLS